MREQIIMFGAGKRLNEVLTTVEMRHEFQVIEVWDNDSRKWGNTIRVFDDKVLITEPHHLDKKVPIVIYTDIYYDEIRQELEDLYCISRENIKTNRYLFHNIKTQIMDRYKDSKDEHIVSILEYLKNHELGLFNYCVLDEYNIKNKNIEVIFD